MIEFVLFLGILGGVIFHAHVPISVHAIEKAILEAVLVTGLDKVLSNVTFAFFPFGELHRVVVVR